MIAQRHAGIVFILLASLAFSVMSLLGKWLSAGYPVGEIVFFRCVFALLPLAWVIQRSGGIATLKTRRIGGHARRCVLGVGSMAGHFTALGLMPLADLTTINFTGPLFIVLLSGLILREPVGAARWAAVVVGFLGVAIVTRPGMAGSGASFASIGALIALGGALCYAVAIITTRQLASTERDTTIVFYNQSSCALVFALTLPFAWVTPTWGDFVLFVAMGVTGGLGQYWMTKAYHIGPTSLVAPFSYAGLIWAIFHGVVFFGDWPDWATLIGAAVVVGSGLQLLRYEQRARRL